MDNLIGQTISHYRILEQIGQGGMGEVYLAEDTELDRKVALKFLPSRYSDDPEIKSRFKQEAKAAAGLNHPNIVTIHEVGEHEGRMFIVMEYTEGESLSQLLTREELSIEKAIELASQVCAGLSEAHQAGIVHRDIKPANILIDTKGRVRVADFGLAKTQEGTRLTKEQSTLGTADYMSPEQARGEDVDRRSDIFSFGVVLYEMIAGQRPFQGDYHAAVSYSVVHEDPEPLARYKTGVSDRLQRIVDKALDKNPDTRYQHIDDLLADLKKQAMGSAPVVTRKKKGFVAITSLAAVVAAVIAVVGYFFFSGEESTERVPIAVADFVNQTSEPELDGLSGMLITSLEQSRRLSVLTRSRMFDILKQMGKQNVGRIDESIGREICKRADVNALVTATVSKLGKLYTIDLKVFDVQNDEHLVTAREQEEGQESVLAMLDRLSEKTRQGLKERESDIQAANRTIAAVTTTNLEAYRHFFLGEMLYNQAQYNQAQFEEAAKEFEKAIALDSTFALAYYYYASIYNWANIADLGDRRRKQLEILGKIPDISRIPDRELYLIDALRAYASKSTRVEGFLANLAILKEMEKRYPNDKEMLFGIGDAFFHLPYYSAPAIRNFEDYSSAVAYFEKALTLDPEFERVYWHLPEAYQKLGDSTNAMAAAEKLISLNKRVGSLALAMVYNDQGKNHEAINVAQNVLQTDSKNLEALEIIVNACRQSGNNDLALKYATKLASAVDSTNSGRLRFLANANLAEDHYELALRFADQFITFDQPFGYYISGTIHLAAGNYRTASEALHPSMTQGSIEIYTRLQYLIALTASGHDPDAIRETKAFLRTAEGSPRFVAAARFYTGDIDEKTYLMETAGALRPDTRSQRYPFYFLGMDYLLGIRSESVPTKDDSAKAVAYLKAFLGGVLPRTWNAAVARGELARVEKALAASVKK